MENTNLKNEQVTNPLLNPLNHSLEVLLNEIKRGRPAETQLQIQKWIDELTQEKLLGKTISKEVADKDSFEETCDRLFPTAAIERKIVKENQQKDKETQGYICPKTKILCDDECCVSAEDCHIEAGIDVISEPKQETLEEASDKYSKKSNTYVFQESHKRDFIAGAKCQAERMCNHTYILTSEQGHRVIKCQKCDDTQPI